MCGIVGILDLAGRPVPKHELQVMNAQIVHRGPDDDGYWVGDQAGLAMRRLSIIDLAGGKQPIANEDGTVVTVFNGEIYNFRALREGLIDRGHRFNSKTDTEVIPHLYEEKGASFVEELNGMFAIALWDRSRRRLLLVRDRLGIKPLFYVEYKGRLLFASELKSLVAAGIEKTVSPAALYHYLTYSYVPSPLTIYKGVYRLPPGHLAECSESMVKIRQYWNVHPSPVEGRSEEEWLEELDDLLLDAVGRRMIADVPLGAFLSGGVDSSLLVSLMSRCSDRPVRTFTISFGESSHDEARHARAVAKRFGTEHEDLVVRPNVADHFEKIVQQFDEPFADASAIPTFFLSALTRQHVTVALSGDGGDEVFGGYHRYIHYFRKRPLFKIPLRIRRGTLGLLGQCLPERMRGKRFLHSLTRDPLTDYVVGDDEISPRALLSDTFLPASSHVDTMDIAAPYIGASYPSELDALCMHDLKLYLPDDILTKVDRMSMAVSLEVRVPFLDHRVVEFGFRLPAHLRLRHRTGKYLLKRLLARHMPPEHVHRTKMGFGVPLAHWFRNELSEFLQDILSPQAVRRVGFFDPAIVRRMITEHMTGSRNFEGRLWRVLVAQIWAERCLHSSAGATSPTLSPELLC